MDNCQRCKKQTAAIKSRKESFCEECFAKFVSLKQRKRMMGDDFYRDVFKVSYNKDGTHGVGRVVMGFDFQSSCLVALDVIIQVLREQNRQHRGKVGFELDLVAVYEDKENFNNLKESWNAITTSERYSQDDILNHVNIHFIDVNTFYNNKSLRQILVHNVDFDVMAMKWEENDKFSVADLLKLCPNRNTRNDFWNSIIQHTVKKFAMQSHCSALIWGHSMTRLADQILGMVIKGRGAHVASSLDTDNFDEAYGGSFKNLYPMKDILLSEIDAYIISQGLEPYLVDYTLRRSLLISEEESKKDNTNGMLIKNMTINELVRKYYNDMEGEYSNIVSTVLRTGDKLQTPIKHLEEGVSAKKCSVCSNAIYTDPSLWLRSITVIKGHSIETEEEQDYYNQWKESKVGIETEQYMKLKDTIWKNGEDISLCYGCTINLNGIKGKNIIWPKNDDEELHSVLDEYQLTDGEDENI